MEVNSETIRRPFPPGFFRTSPVDRTGNNAMAAENAIVARLSRGSVRGGFLREFEVAVDHLVNGTVLHQPPLLNPQAPLA